MALVPQKGPLASQEALLLEYVERLEKHKDGRLAVHIHISRLQPQNRRDQHVRMASSSFESMVRTMQGQLFQLSNNDLMFIFKKDARDAVESGIIKLRFTFADDPLVGELDEDGNSAFETWYDLKDDFDKLLDQSKQLLEEAEERFEQQRRQRQMGDQGLRRRRQDPLTPDKLIRVEKTLAQADLSNLLRRQSICAIVGKSPPQPIYRELFVSIADLRDTVVPNVDLVANRWLFQHMTDTLDRRVLAMLSKHDDRTLDADIAINLNVSTLLSEDFLNYDDNVKAGMRGSIILELQAVDIFADLSIYLFARDVAHEMGYRLCIDGMNVRTLEYIDRARLGADMIKLFWSDEIAEWMDNPEKAEHLRAMLKNCGLNRVVLGRCDDDRAIEIGQSLGLTLFQGRHIENLIAAENSQLNKRRGPTVLLTDEKSGKDWR